MATSGDVFFLLKVADELRGPCRYYRDFVPPSSHPVIPPETRPTGFSLYQFFAPGGLLSKTHPAYEFRRGQLQMAQAVEEALEEKRHLIVEAGTGTGKTLAYLLPIIRSVARSGRRVIISTGTKNLQEQLFFKDVPALERALFPEGDRKLSVCYMKGRNNYLCRKKLFDLTDQPVLTGLEEIEHYRAIAAWEKTTQTGDRAELAELPETSALWHKLDARADTCLGQKCKEYDRCFITEMRRRAAESDIIIVNHHLFFADLSIKLEAEGAPDAGVLPDCGAVIFDEAHELEEVAGNYFGISVSNLRMDELARDVEHLLQREKLLRCRERFSHCESVRSFSLRCCPRAKAGLPSIPAVSSSKKTAKSFSPSNNRCIAWPRNWSSFHRSRKKSSHWFGERSNCRCNSNS